VATEIKVLRTVVDGAIGELKVTFENKSGGKLDEVRMAVEHGGPVSPDAAGHLAYVPGTAEGGYAVGSVAAGATVERVFAVKPIDAEAGKTYKADATVSFKGGTESASAELFVEARPEVYAAIGAVETLRAQFLDLYNNAKEKGREVHEHTALPETKGDPASRVLQPTSFQWALQMVEVGTKMFRASGPPRGSGDAEKD
jgi:hypothetical protein